eukprot:2867382-Rhodomonas_salina.2
MQTDRGGTRVSGVPGTVPGCRPGPSASDPDSEPRKLSLLSLSLVLVVVAERARARGRVQGVQQGYPGREGGREERASMGGVSEGRTRKGGN